MVISPPIITRISSIYCVMPYCVSMLCNPVCEAREFTAACNIVIKERYFSFQELCGFIFTEGFHVACDFFCEGHFIFSIYFNMHLRDCLCMASIVFCFLLSVKLFCVRLCKLYKRLCKRKHQTRKNPTLFLVQGSYY